jgi:hypothetical protein
MYLPWGRARSTLSVPKGFLWYSYWLTYRLRDAPVPFRNLAPVLSARVRESAARSIAYFYELPRLISMPFDTGRSQTEPAGIQQYLQKSFFESWNARVHRDREL